MVRTSGLVRVAGAALLAATLLGAGCSAGTASSGASPDASSAAVSAESSPAAAAVLVLGPQDEGNPSCTFTNQIDAPIADIAVTAAGAPEGEPALLIENGQQVAVGEAFTVYQQPVEGSAVFDVTVSTADASYTLHNVDFSRMAQADIRLEGAVAYLEAEVDGAPVSTLQDEMAIAEAEAQAAAEAAAAAEAQAAAEQAAAAAAATAPAPAAQSEDRCVGDVVLR